MSTTTYKTLDSSEEINNEIVIQITKNQLITFFRTLLLLFIISVNIFAVATKSSLFSELIIAEIILALVFFIKYHKSNKILNS